MKIKYGMLTCLLLWATMLTQAQTARPKLAIGIVVDQMRMEYLYRFASNFGNKGFNRLMNEGFVCYNTQIDYLPTVTGPGHTSIYTGTTPRYHGICGNSWFDRESQKSVYCASDPSVETIGNDKKEKGSYSANNMQVPTIGDVLKLSTSKHGKVYAISLKDRAAAFPAGHAADGAFWFDKKTGNFVSSTYYMNRLPEWLTRFNQSKKADSYLDSTWKPLYKPENYRFSMPENDYLRYCSGKGLDSLARMTLRQSAKKGEAMYNPVYDSPFGNKLLTDLAIETIRNTDLGKDEYPDLLAISYSSPDAIGHTYGPTSQEENDTYARLDAEIARLLAALDTYVGKNNYVLFLTADHGMSEIPALLTDNRIPGGYLDETSLKLQLDSMLVGKYGPGKWIDAVVDDQIYLNQDLIAQKKLRLTDIQNNIAAFARSKDGIADAFTSDQLTRFEFVNALSGRVQKGFNYRRGGDIIVTLMPGWMAGSEKDETAATHGSGFNCDTNIPLIWFGTGIPKGCSYERYGITDIAPTVSALLHIMYPSASIGNPITEVLR